VDDLYGLTAEGIALVAREFERLKSRRPWETGLRYVLDAAVKILGVRPDGEIEVARKRAELHVSWVAPQAKCF
jgi:hypothetical protein